MGTLIELPSRSDSQQILYAAPNYLMADVSFVRKPGETLFSSALCTYGPTYLGNWATNILGLDSDWIRSMYVCDACAMPRKPGGSLEPPLFSSISQPSHSVGSRCVVWWHRHFTHPSSLPCIYTSIHSYSISASLRRKIA